MTVPQATSPQLDPLFAAFQVAVAGRYSLERELGRGGMGIVYLAHEVRLERPVALKLLPPDVAAHPSLRERFLREARTAARLSHPNIIPIHAVDEAGGFVYFAMAYVPGETLAQRVERRGPLPATAAARVLREVAWALAYAHAQGVVHRDIKPENVLLERGSGRAMVADFGIASVEDATRDSTPGQLIGTPEFMSPEQAAGEPVDGRSDLYSLGALGYYLLAGRPPFQGQSAATVLSQHLTAPVPSLVAAIPELPEPLALLLERCLAKSPAERPSNGEQLAEELGVVLEADPEPPAGLRAYLRRVNLSLGGVLVGALLVPAIMRFGPPTPMVVAVVARVLIGLAIGAAMFAYAVPLLFKQLQEAGYAPADVAQTADALARRRRDEEGFLGKWDRSRSPEGARRLFWSFVVVFLVQGIGELVSPSVGWRGPLFAAVLGLGALLQLSIMQLVRGSSTTLTARLWRSRWLGRWWERVTGTTPAQGNLPGGRTTELRLGNSVDELFAALPLEMRRRLKEVLPLVRRLEVRGKAIRGGLAGPDGTAAASRLELVVAALRTIRLDLLRLKAGATTVERITADLAAAAAVEAQVDRLMSAKEEVERLLKAPSEG